MSEYGMILERDGERCWHCGTRTGTVHHRINRGMGGSRDPKIHAPSNLLAICPIFNEQMESDATMAELARRYGWKLSPGDDPLEWPAYDAQATIWYRLDDEYGRTPSGSSRIPRDA